VDDVMGPTLGEIEKENMIKQISNERDEGVNNMFEELGLEALFSGCLSSVPDSNYTFNVMREEKMTRGVDAIDIVALVRAS
jgi:hypothetical protein